MGSQGTSSGPALMRYSGYRVSEILADLSDQPVQYRASDDPRVDFRFSYPDMTPEEGKSEAIRSLAEYVSGRSDTVDVVTDGYLLAPSATFGQGPSAAPGTKLQVEGQSVRADELSIGELAALLRKYRSETYFSEQPACCTTVSFERDVPVAELRQQLLSVSGVDFRPVKRNVATLRVSDN